MVLTGCAFFGAGPDGDGEEGTVPDWTDPGDDLIETEVTYTTPVECPDPFDRFVDTTSFWGLEYTPRNPPWDGTANGYSSLDVELIGGFAVTSLVEGRIDLITTDADGPMRHFASLNPEGPVEPGLPLDLLMPDGFNVGVSTADFDGDRDLDVLVLRDGPDTLWENVGGLLYPLDELAGPDARSMSATWADVDQDGDLDVYVARHGSGAILPDVIYDPDRDSLFLQQDDGRFVDVIDDVLPVEDDGHGYVAGWLDADGDGWLDLYVVNDLGAEPENPPSIFLRGTGDPDVPLEHHPDAHLDLAMFGMGLAIADYDLDGDEDLHVTDIGGSYLGRNDGGIFSDLSLQLDSLSNDPSADIGWASEWLDVEQDGFLELFNAFGHMPSKPDGAPGGATNALDQADGVWLVSDLFDSWWAASPGLGLANVASTRTAVAADLDRDGFAEVVTWGLDEGLRVHRAPCTDNRWLRVELDHTGTNNRFGIGAYIEASVDGRLVASRRMRAGTSLSSGLPEVLLGLGSANVVDLRIVWPDQQVSVVENLPTRRAVSIVR